MYVKNVLIYTGSQNSFVRYVSDGIEKELKKKHYNVISLDITSEDYLERVADIFKTQEIYFSIGHNEYGINLFLDDNMSLYEYYDVPHVVLYDDAPYNIVLSTANKCKCKNLIVAVRDRSHIECLNYENISSNIKMGLFLPFSANIEPEETNIHVKKDIDVLYRSCYYGSMDRGMWHNPSINTTIIKILDEVADVGEQLPVTVLESFKIVLKAHKMEEMCFLPILYKFFTPIYQYIKTYRRNRLLNSLVKKGFKINVCDRSWESAEFADKLLIHKTELSDSLELNRRSKVLIQDMAEFNDGIHPRMLNSILLGTPVISEYSKFVDEEFENEKDYFLYKWNNIEKASEYLENLLSDEIKRKESVYSAWGKIISNHTAANEAEKIVNAVELYIFGKQVGAV